MQNKTDVFIAFLTVACVICILGGILRGLRLIFEYMVCYL